MKILSNAFSDGDFLPAKYTCDGEGISPELHWLDIPANAKSLALIFDDPDAPRGTWTHWVLYDIPPTVLGLAEDIKDLPSGTIVGNNSWPKQGYGAPCPPTGVHRYIFKLYALDSELNLKPKATSEELQKAMQNHVLAEAKLLGKYKRSKY